MKLSLPYPPSANRLWRNWRGRMVLSTEGRAYKQGVKLRALTQGCRPLEGPVVVSVTAYRPRRIGDLDNALKALLDALKGVAFVDDDQVVEIHAMRLDDKADPRVVVEIEEQMFHTAVPQGEELLAQGLVFHSTKVKP